MGLVEYYKNSRDFIRYKRERTLRYNHIAEMIEYFEKKIFKQEKERLMKEEKKLPEEAEQEARKKAWVDFIPVKLNELAEVNKREREMFSINRIFSRKF